jgi:hypothetical protein
MKLDERRMFCKNGLIGSFCSMLTECENYQLGAFLNVYCRVTCYTTVSPSHDIHLKNFKTSNHIVLNHL